MDQITMPWNLATLVTPASFRGDQARTARQTETGLVLPLVETTSRQGQQWAEPDKGVYFIPLVLIVPLVPRISVKFNNDSFE